MNKSYKILGSINRNTKKFKNLFCSKNLFCFLMRSNLELGPLIWPCYITYINEHENVQFKVLKRICFNSRDFSDFIQYYIRLDSLAFRQNHTNIMLIFDIRNGYVKCSELLVLIGFRIPSKSSQNNNLFVISSFKTNSGS